MKKNVFILIALFSLVFSSCSNQENDFLEEADMKISNKSFEVVNLSDFINTRAIAIKDQLVIRFLDENAFDNTVVQMQAMPVPKQLAWASDLKGFTSIQEIFNQAMIDIENVDETEASYMAFKRKYDQYLYFPMYMEDRGCYMPISEQGKSSIASPDGYVIVGNQVRNVKDISTYDALQITGQAYYPPSPSPAPIFPTGVEDGKTSSNFIGSEIDSGWFQEGKRKLRIKIGRKSNKLNMNPVPYKPGQDFQMNLKLEVSFRKKTWLGWSNYSGETTTDMVFNIGGQIKKYNHHENGWSSHDWLCGDPLPFSRVDVSATRPLFYTPPINASFTVDFRGFSKPKTWTTSLQGVNFVEW